MRNAVALVTTLATVLHLAVGCCGHLSHFDCGLACCVQDSACEQAIECCADHDHDQDNRSQPTSHGVNASESTGIHRVVTVRAAIHDCGGCTCVAKVEQDRVDDAAPTVSYVLTAVAFKAIAMAQAARGPCEAWTPPVSAELRPPLFERLVV